MLKTARQYRVLSPEFALPQDLIPDYSFPENNSPQDSSHYVDTLRRARRNRKSPAVRALVQEARLTPQNLVQGYFLVEGNQKREPILSMPGICRLSVDLVIEEAKQIYDRGVPAICLFPVLSPEYKDEYGSAIFQENGYIVRAIQALKTAIPYLCLILDLALDPYTSHGHDGIVNAQGEVLNDETVEALARAAVLFGRAGVDMMAPSDMMDGRIRVIRRALDEARLQHVSLVAHSAKYASAFYGPYRDALASAPRFGDKKTYQLDPANAREALLETGLDEEEGADFLMIKPALAYLDIIAKVRAQTTLPIAAFNVSGEYAMVMAASQQGWLDRDRAFYEMLLSMKRAGADAIFTYAAPLALDYMARAKSRVTDF